MDSRFPAPGKPWAQISIDVLDTALGCELAGLSVEAGADLVEVGTPLVFYAPITVIGSMVEAAGATPVLVDFKAQDGVHKYFIEAKRQGAAFAVVLAVCNDGTMMEAVRAKEDCGINVVADLFSVPFDQLASRAEEVERLGADMVLLHVGHDQYLHEETRRYPLAGLDAILERVSIPVAAVSFSIEQAIEAAKMGASCVVQGHPYISAENPLEEIRKFVDAVHSAV